MSKLKNKFNNFIQWARYEANRSDKTISLYQEAYSDYIKFIELSKQKTTFTTKQLRKYFFYLREKGLKKTTVLVRYKALKAFAKWMIIIDKSLKISPFDDIFKPIPDKTLPEFFSLEESQLIIEAIEGYPWKTKFLKYRNKLIIYLLLFCGLRKSEMLNLMINDIDLNLKTIRINKGKGNKDRIIKIHPSLEIAFKRYLNVRGKSQINKLLLSSYRRDQPFSDTGLKRLMNLIERQTGIHSYPHKMRHTFATLMLHGGANLEVIRQMLGHTKLSTTARYLHASPQMQAEQLNKHPLGL